MQLSLNLRRKFIDAVDRVFDVYAKKSYSQEGEDIILRRIFAGKKSGFFVDVGAHHPRRFSNTFHFYQQGWRGMNIEPNPDVVSLFRTARRRDVNLQLGISDHSGTLTYYSFDEPALNTFDTAIVERRISESSCRAPKAIQIPVDSLANVLSKHLPKNQAIDFLTIDVEGLDLAVLRSNDWKRFRPACVLVEALGRSVEEVIGGEIYGFMKQSGYELFAKTFNTLVFRDRSEAI